MSNKLNLFFVNYIFDSSGGTFWVCATHESFLLGEMGMRYKYI